MEYISKTVKHDAAAGLYAAIALGVADGSRNNPPQSKEDVSDLVSGLTGE